MESDITLFVLVLFFNLTLFASLQDEIFQITGEKSLILDLRFSYTLDEVISLFSNLKKKVEVPIFKPLVEQT